MIALLLPILIVILLILGVMAIWHRSVYIGIISIIISIGVNIYCECFPIHFSFGNKNKETDIRVLSYNIKYNSDYLKNNKDSLNKIMSFFIQQDADIVVLPESRLHSCCELLYSKMSSLYPYHLSLGNENKDYYLETFVFSRYPITNAQQLGKNYIYAMDIALSPADTLQLVACHLTSNQANSQLNGGKGLWSNLKNGYDSRYKQAQLICNKLKYCTKPLLICGDFNDISGSTTLNTMQENLQLQNAWWKKGCGYGATFADKGLYLRLDHLLFSEHFSIINAQVPSINLSDHYPLIIDLKLESKH